jgi:pimeloyl-ACP methyl ester carboxylesterase
MKKQCTGGCYVYRERFGKWCETAAGASAGGWFGRHTEVAGELLHFVEAGEGTPLLLLHGFLEWSYTWRHNLPVLAESARVLALDLRGFGLSERSRRRGHTLADQVEVVRGFMDQLGIERAVLCGHSMGGEVALRFALQYPDRVLGLILDASSGYLQRQDGRLYRWLLGTPGLRTLAIWGMLRNRRFARRALESGYGAPDRVQEADVAAYMLPARAPGSARALVRILRETDFGTHAHRLAEVNHRALLIWGENDRVVPLAHGRRLAAELPDARLITFPGCGHLPHEECPDAFNAAVLDFLRSRL